MSSNARGRWARAVARVGRPVRGWRNAPRRLTALLAQRPFADHRSDSHADRSNQVRYYLGRARRARDAGDFPRAVSEARRALEWNPHNPWVLALLGQCLFRGPHRDLAGARAALERAWSLDPTNGYFVGLLLDVLDAQHDASARDDLLTWAWWQGAPVERWLPDGPAVPHRPDQSPAQPAALTSSPIRPVQDRSTPRRPATVPVHA